MTVPVEQPPQPYIPFAPGQNTLRGIYNSIAEVHRVSTARQPDGTMETSWNTIPDILDQYLQVPGQMWCRLAVGFVRRGIDQPMPLVAGRAPDRIAVAYFDLATDDTGHPLVLSGDRLVMVAGSIFGTWEIRVVPDVAQNYIGASHVEVQVVETSQALQPGSPQPFPGSPA